MVSTQNNSFGKTDRVIKNGQLLIKLGIQTYFNVLVKKYALRASKVLRR